jgi:hypothetical protein
MRKGEPYYIFLLFPCVIFRDKTYEEYREVRRFFLTACCGVVRLLNSDAEDIVAIATESGFKNNGRSEDAIYFDGRHWNEELANQAKEFQEKMGILTNPVPLHFHLDEYPDVPLQTKIKNPRNKKCPCGSGKKYKHCCLK